MSAQKSEQIVSIAAHTHRADPIIFFPEVRSYECIIGAGAEITCIDRRSLDTPSFPDTVRSMTYHVGAGARVSLVYDYACDEQTPETITHTFRLERDSHVMIYGMATGGLSTRLAFTFMLLGTGASVKLRGMYAKRADQKMMMTSEQCHYAPHTTSDIRLNGCLAGSAQATYHGRIYINPSAQHADATQRNDTLLLEGTARALSVPSLEVLAHKVTCAHGAALGLVASSQLRYLESRGLSTEIARKILIEGFMHTSFGASTSHAMMVHRAVDYITGT